MSFNESYQPQHIEEVSQKYWQSQQTFTSDENSNKENYYCLSMLPYPSGELHMGHVRNYTIGDIISKYQMLQGKNVLQPMGWDAFGLPAENAAIKNNIHPNIWIKQNISNMKSQLIRLGYGIDWSREITTSEPEYYRWEQWLFLKMYEKGLVYRKKSLVNWDPVDNTVLANEQVIDGKGWRSGAAVERKEIYGWFIKTTAYQDELLTGLETLDDWPNEVKTMQKNWIGKSIGAEIEYTVEGQDNIKVFTTRPDTLMGNTYMAVAFDHPLALAALDADKGCKEFIQNNSVKTTAEADLATMEKLGYQLPYTAIHPISGAKLPIWVANFVLSGYGTGAVMAVPAHDSRDFEFATKYKLPIVNVIKNINESSGGPSEAYTGDGDIINSGEFDGLSSADAQAAIIKWLETNSKGSKKTQYRLNDWGVSRQRYWGCPIPIIYCNDCGTVPESEQNLPVKLPTDLAVTPAGSALAQSDKFLNTKCPKCSKPAQRDPDTFDTFVDSSWYFLRYISSDQNNSILDGRAKSWSPINQYIGGIEHAILHLLYARFMHKVIRDFGFVDSDEPFTKLLTQGMVLKDGAKMSKSKGNIVPPMPLINKYGADTVRLFITFASPPEQSLEWSDDGVEGAYKFLKRLWSFCITHKNKITIDNEPSKNHNDDVIDINNIIKQAQYDYSRQQFNTIVAASMKIFNIITKLEQKNDFESISYSIYNLIIILAPICPHITHVLWRELNFGDNVLNAKWLQLSEQDLRSSNINIVVQINGKKLLQLSLPQNVSAEEVEKIVISDEKVKNRIGENSVKKFIYVPKRLANVVI
ncbi:MAG: leucine--tRNA ligase [Legionellales bacterium]|nr:leucine--tRNA ligase [Legionellales bacterium]